MVRQAERLMTVALEFGATRLAGSLRPVMVAGK
jgi:hypothetical protein